MTGALRELAEYMADFFSQDAAYWPLEDEARASGAPLRVAFRWFGFVLPPAGRELLDDVKAVLASPYRSADRATAAVIVHAASESEAVATIVLCEAMRDGEPGIAYEISFPHTGDLYPGWFALRHG